jgi:hypothetical protein
MAVPMPADRDPAIIDAAQRLRPAPVPRPLQLLVQLTLDHGLDKAAHPITHRGFNRIEPTSKKYTAVSATGCRRWPALWDHVRPDLN